MNRMIANLIFVVATLYSIATLAQNELPPQTLFTNVHVCVANS